MNGLEARSVKWLLAPPRKTVRHPTLDASTPPQGNGDQARTSGKRLLVRKFDLMSAGLRVQAALLCAALAAGLSLSAFTSATMSCTCSWASANISLDF